jgi:hypothetical protein
MDVYYCLLLIFLISSIIRSNLRFSDKSEKRRQQLLQLCLVNRETVREAIKYRAPSS